MEVLLISVENRISPVVTVLQQILISKGHVCKYLYIDLPEYKHDNSYMEKVAKQINEISKDAKLIGFSCMTFSFLFCKELLSHIKKNSNAKIIFGGVHPTVKPYEVLEVADYVCVGEGEEALVELVEALENNKPTNSIKNIFTKSNGKVITNELRPLIKDLNSLPYPKYLVDKIYICSKGIIYNLNQNKHLLKRVFPGTYHIVGARGCPYQCTYCINGALTSLKKEYYTVRRRSYEHILAEINDFIKTYKTPIRIGFVEDDFCAQSEGDLQNFIERYKRDVGLPFLVFSTPSSISSKKMDLLVGAGLVRIQMGIQSINENVLKEIYKRPATRAMVKRGIDIISKYRNKVELMYDAILDNPWEGDSSKIETLRFLFEIPKPATFNLYSLTLYPGTPLYYRAQQEGLIKDEISEVYQKDFVIDLKNNSTNSLFILYTKYHFPAFLIKAALILRKFKLINFILKKSTIPLLRLHDNMQRFSLYVTEFFEAIITRNSFEIGYYLKLPFNKISRLFYN